MSVPIGQLATEEARQVDMVYRILEEPALDRGVFIAHRTHRPFEVGNRQGSEFGSLGPPFCSRIGTAESLHAADHRDNSLMLSRASEVGSFLGGGGAWLFGNHAESVAACRPYQRRERTRRHEAA